MKKKYIKPEIKEESLEVDASFALGCGSSIPAFTVSCVQMCAPNEYEELINVWGFTPDSPLDVAEYNGIVFSNSSSCAASCYQGPYDTFFAS